MTQGANAGAYCGKPEESALVLKKLQLLGGRLEGRPEGTLHSIAAKYLYPPIPGAHLSICDSDCICTLMTASHTAA